ncbi:acyl carrier protein [Anaerosolibacter carboniphilus]|uniref:Acyl carrier protein n=1 Tax=Anaerosolibacter carboniphilus TaxID=1417629 RepID=A0A841KSQ2_9FIRM|nr:acyl carrier protein [Anaerosolibacter carboniphilus]MBB6216431.1 acyl carrier protein [Anaerosolibacter carboniphilus]
MKDNEKRLKQVMMDVLDISYEAINEDTSVDTVDEWDSVKHLNLVLAIEAEFDITFTEEQTVEILSYPLIKIVLEEHGIRFDI